MIVKMAKHNSSNQTWSNLREKVALNPLFFVSSFLSCGTKQSLKAPGMDWNLDLNIASVRIWSETNFFQ